MIPGSKTRLTPRHDGAARRRRRPALNATNGNRIQDLVRGVVQTVCVVHQWGALVKGRKYAIPTGKPGCPTVARHPRWLFSQDCTFRIAFSLDSGGHFAKSAKLYRNDARHVNNLVEQSRPISGVIRLRESRRHRGFRALMARQAHHERT